SSPALVKPSVVGSATAVRGQAGSSAVAAALARAATAGAADGAGGCACTLTARAARAASEKQVRRWMVFTAFLPSRDARFGFRARIGRDAVECKGRIRSLNRSERCGARCTPDLRTAPTP